MIWFSTATHLYLHLFISFYSLIFTSDFFLCVSLGDLFNKYLKIIRSPSERQREKHGEKWRQI